MNFFLQKASTVTMPLDMIACQDAIKLFVLCVVILLVLKKVSKCKFLIRKVLRALRHGGPIPRHVAFIMDGNRRWARKLKLEVHQGHAQGGEKLIESLEWCLDAGVEVVTVYAFSIENFKRPKSEVDEIMKLCEIKFREILERRETIHRNRVRVRVLGELSRLSPALQQLMRKIMANTSNFTDGPLLNICFSYACRYDIANSVSTLVSMCDLGKIQYEDITDGSVASYLCTGFANGNDPRTCYPDLLVRTSGETRLSDFLLWESCFSVLSFCNTLWPDLSAWDFVRMIIDYQALVRGREVTLSQFKTDRYFAQLEDVLTAKECSARVVKAIGESRERHFTHLHTYTSNLCS